jgi:hypothetical protein
MIAQSFLGREPRKASVAAVVVTGSGEELWKIQTHCISKSNQLGHIRQLSCS